MQHYILRRILLLIPTVLGVTVVIFAVMRFLPGDVIDQLTGESTADPEIRRQISDRYGLDQPLHEQYFRWMSDIGSGTLGTSILSRRTVASELRARAPVSLQLGAMAIVVSLVVALPIGVLSAAKQDSVQDYLGRGFSILLLAIPNFWLATLAIAYGFVWFGWTPPLRYVDLWDNPVENLKILWVPAVIVGCSLGGSTMRIVRSAMLEVLRQDYMRTAHAKGLSGWTAMTRHGLRNALLPVVTVVGLQVPIVISGTVVVERIFSLPGVGSYLLSSLQQRDYPVVQAIVFIA
jgi:peptide/nickel transport system permease protein